MENKTLRQDRQDLIDAQIAYLRCQLIDSIARMCGFMDVDQLSLLARYVLLITMPAA